MQQQRLHQLQQQQHAQSYAQSQNNSIDPPLVYVHQHPHQQQQISQHPHQQQLPQHNNVNQQLQQPHLSNHHVPYSRPPQQQYAYQVSSHSSHPIQPARSQPQATAAPRQPPPSYPGAAPQHAAPAAQQLHPVAGPSAAPVANFVVTSAATVIPGPGPAAASSQHQ